MDIGSLGDCVKTSRKMSILVLFIVGGFCSWRADQEGPLYPKTIWLPFVLTLAWVVLGFVNPQLSIDAAWNDFLAQNHASAEARAEYGYDAQDLAD
jgi:hypothetical protein